MVIRLVLLLLAMLSLAPSLARAADRFFTTTDGVRLHYIEAGRGHTIVLVPGWTMPAWIWSAQIADFSRHYHVVAFDPRSQGASDLAWSGNEPFRRGQDIAELIARLPAEPVLLVGWSLGVLDSLSYLHQFGDGRLAGLVLVDNSVGENPPPAPERYARAARRTRPPPRADSVRAFVRGMFVRPQPSAYLDRLAEASLRTPESVAAQLLAYPVPRSFWREAVYSTSRPILYVVRPWLGGQAANLVARDPAAESAVLAGVGHAMFAEDPARFDALMGDFIRRRVWH